MDVETPDRGSNGLNPDVNAWVEAMRLRTLPLSLSSVFTGSFLALQREAFDGWILALTALTTVFLQVNSNLANDYGDFVHGSDNEARIGPQRTLQAGLITPQQMRRAIVSCSLLALASGSGLLYVAELHLWLKLVLLGLGLIAIYASITYTAGSNPYGYRGWGDLSVVLFFGFLGVIGSYVLQVGQVDVWVILPALSIGTFSAGVLNVNNTRDIESDEASGKRTFAVKLGPERARAYHVFLLFTGWMAMLAYAFRFFEWGWSWLFCLSLPLFLLNALRVVTTREAQRLDPFLKQLALSTFLFSLLLGVGIALSLA